MNDDFLHRIRVEPPPDFLARLKSRLDLQPPPTAPRPTLSGFQKLAVGLLLTGSVFAITLLVLNRKTLEAPVEPDKGRAMGDIPVVVHSAPEIKEPAPQASHETAAKPVPDVRPTTLSSPMTLTYVTTKALEPYLTSQLVKGGSHTVVVPRSASEALAEFCHTNSSTRIEGLALFTALVTQRMAPSELDRCSHNIGKVSEFAMGHQVVVLARSRLYGAFNLTPTDIFLALAAEIPDPNEPEKLIPNPNTMWSDVNSALEREPIEFYGPEPSSPVGIAFREIFFETGCRALPGMAARKQCPNLRNDGVYATAEPDILLKLQTKPNAFGILQYSFAARNTSELEVSPIQGVVPAMETIANDTYPGSRPLYLYNNQTWNGVPWLLSAQALSSYQTERFAIIPSERSHQP